jgi:hypothetical protein
LAKDQTIITYSLPKIISLQNGRKTIISVQKAARVTNRKRKVEDILRQATRDSNNSGNSNSDSENEAPAPTSTKNKSKGKAKTKIDNTRKSLRKKAKKT